MHQIELILTLTAALSAALALGFLAFKLRLPPIVGYLVAGLIIGPYTPGFIADKGIAGQLAEVGVILLMFGVGLQFHLKDFLAVRNIAISGALGQIAIVTLLAALTGRSFGWSWEAGVVFGIALSIASTVVLTRVLADNRDLQSQAGRVSIGWLVVEDIITVFVLVVLPALFSQSAIFGQSVPVAVGVAALKLVALVAATLAVGGRLIPRLLTSIARTHSRELFTLTVLVIALGIAVGSALVFGVSMALGAFLAGMVVGQSEFSYRAASEALPMRDAFAVLFFVSVGMLFDPGHLIRAPLLTIITAALVIIAKPLVAFLIVIIFGCGMRLGLRVAIARAQIGEFSFILATLGDQLGILPTGAAHSVVAASTLSITVNPLLYRLIPGFEKALMRSRWLRGILEPASGAKQEVVGGDTRNVRAVVVGYGPVGQSVTNLLQKRGIEPIVIELNIETVRRLNEEGTRAVYGDATQPDILKEAGVATAIGLILSSPASAESAELIRAARAMNPGIRVLVRCAFLSQAEMMRRAGADEVFSGEAEVAMAMIASILSDGGATPEQMDYERESARNELYG